MLGILHRVLFLLVRRLGELYPLLDLVEEWQEEGRMMMVVLAAAELKEPTAVVEDASGRGEL